MIGAEINENEFAQFQKMLYGIAGISLSASKKPLVVSRLSKRLREHQLSSYTEYLKLLDSGAHPNELQTAIDLLTTNETYFFREPNHFQFLRSHLAGVKLNGAGSPFRVWSAASSSGQEAFTIAMVLADCLGTRPWEVMGSDISTQVLAKAKQALYPIEQAEHIPKELLGRYCLKGVGAQAGMFLMARELRDRVSFQFANLNTDLPRLGEFDVVFLRNVMIYFDVDTKRAVVQRLKQHIKPGGYLLIGHSETLNGINSDLKMIAPSIYRNS